MLTTTPLDNPSQCLQNFATGHFPELRVVLIPAHFSKTCKNHSPLCFPPPPPRRCYLLSLHMHKMITPVAYVVLLQIHVCAPSNPCRTCIKISSGLCASLHLFAYNSGSTEQVFMKSDIGEFYDKLSGHFLLKGKKSNGDCTRKSICLSAGISTYVVRVRIILH
jgi:hypothetical protein